MANIDPTPMREFAISVVRQLRAAGYQALWAGGCVRDQLLGQRPKDYDVATSALPDEVRKLFGHKRTLAIGAAFGVITVLGPREAGQLDVATFRTDATYSDGRHPDAITFSTPEHDAQRRDFTINGLFFDPIEERVIDYVGGEADLAARVVRAIRDPAERIEEDKLRMLRAVRFAARLGFSIEAQTLAAIEQRADQLQVVSAERIAAEMEKILVHNSRAQGLALLRQTRLLPEVLPELAEVTDFTLLARELSLLEQPSFAMAIAALLRHTAAARSPLTAAALADQIAARWRLSNHVSEGISLALRQLPQLQIAAQLAWPQLQRMLVQPRIGELLGLLAAVERGAGESSPQTDYCRAKLALPAEQLNPPPLLTGSDLKRAGLSPGPMFREILEQVRDQQLLGQLHTLGDAIEYAEKLAAPG